MTIGAATPDAATIQRIFRECGTTKADHGYAAFYATLPAPGRLLEVGIQRGNSLRAWRRIWPECVVTGLDLDQSHRALWPDGYPMTVCRVGDGRNAELPGLYDLIVDDASHRLGDQLAVYFNLITQLAPHGHYVIEDVEQRSAAALGRAFRIWEGGPLPDSRIAWR